MQKGKHQGKKELDSAKFLKRIKENLKSVDMDTKYLKRAVNDGFSGGEKKKMKFFRC